MKKMFDKIELNRRMDNFRVKMDKDNPGWEMCIIISKVNQYYFVGTMQDGILVIPKVGRPIFWVRRAYQRAIDESAFVDIYPMKSFSDAASYYSSLPEIIHTETKILTIDLYNLLTKHFKFKTVKSLDMQVSYIRSIKSERELKALRKSGKIHKHVLTNIVPGLLYEGVSERDFFANLYTEMVKSGYQGISRFVMFDCDSFTGQVGFGVNSLYPSFFNGPGGQKGLNAAIPFLGDEKSKLKKGDLVFADLACGFDGYHTDSTNTYVFKGQVSDKAKKAHNKCIEIRQQIIERLIPGEIPSKIYSDIIGSLDDDFLLNFMGQGGNQVKFLGHGVGLHVDEFPVIAKGFDMPFEENMVLAIEPKCAIKGVGTVGVEDSYVVTKDGGECLTGHHMGLKPL